MFPGCSAAAAASLLAAAVTGLGEGPAVPLLLEGYSAYFARRIGNKAYWGGAPLRVPTSKCARAAGELLNRSDESRLLERAEIVAVHICATPQTTPAPPRRMSRRSRSSVPAPAPQ